MLSDEEVEEKFRTITRNVRIENEDNLKKCLKNCGTVDIYWGTAPTGKPHIGYLRPMAKIADFLKADCRVTILFADLHAYLDNKKTSWMKMDKRTEYYETIIKGILKIFLKGEYRSDKLRFIRGTDFQLSESYVRAAYEIIRITSVKNAIKAGSVVVEQNEDPALSSLIYPMLQALDEEFLGVDVQFGGEDQQNIFKFAEKILPQMFYAQRIHLSNEMIQGLDGDKMAASKEESSIDLLETEENIRKKLENPINNKEDILKFLKEVTLLENEISDQEENEQCSSNDKEYEGSLDEKIMKLLLPITTSLRKEFISFEELIEEAYPNVDEPEITKEKCNLKISDFPLELNSLKELFPGLSVPSNDEITSVTVRPTILWSCRVNGKPGLGYLIPLRQLAQLSQNKWKVMILIEDVRAFLYPTKDKSSLEVLFDTAKLYKEIFRCCFNEFGGISDNLEIKLGSEFQFSKEYMLLLYQSLALVTTKDCKSVLKHYYIDDEMLMTSSLLCPCMSIVDQLFLGVTVRLFGKEIMKKERLSEFVSFGNLIGKVLDKIQPLYVFHDNLLLNNLSLSLCDTREIIRDTLDKVSIKKDNLINDPVFGIIEKIIWPQLKGGHFSIKKSIWNKYLLLNLLKSRTIDFVNVNDIKEQFINNNLDLNDIRKSTLDNLWEFVLNPIHSRLSNTYPSLLKAAFPSTSESATSINKGICPSDIDIRVACVTENILTDGSYKITLKIGIEERQVTEEEDCQLSPTNYCLVAVTPSTNIDKMGLVGILTNAINGSAIKLKKKPYSSIVTFENQKIILPHLKNTDKESIRREIEEHCVILEQKLIWLGEEFVGKNLNHLIQCGKLIKIRVK